MAGAKIINCPNCSQEYEASFEHIGMEMQCTECSNVFKIPNLFNIASAGSTSDAEVDTQPRVSQEELDANRRLNSPLLDSLDDSELQLLKQEGDQLIEILSQLKRRNCWEYSVLAVVLNNRLESLRKASLHTKYEPVYQKSWMKNKGKYHGFLRGRVKEFTSILTELNTTITIDFYRILRCNSVPDLISFAEKIDLSFHKLKRFHEKNFEEAIPPEDVYESAVLIITGWVPYCCKAFDLVIEGLNKNSKKMRDSVIYQPELSFFSPTLHQFFKIADRLGLGLCKTLTVYQDLS